MNNDNATASVEPDPRSLSTPELVTYIVSRHHAFLRTALPFLVPLAAKVARVHGDHDPRLRDLQAEFLELRESLEDHLDQEEQVLFREVVADAPDPGLLGRELAGLREEHRALEEAFGRVRTLCDGYAPPSWACSSYRTLLAELQRLEEDVLLHFRLESDVLLPRFG